VCDSADAIESILIQHPELANKASEVKQVRSSLRAGERDLGLGESIVSIPPALMWAGPS
jgi:hypothetical protein